MTTQQISGITPPLERDSAGVRYLRDVRVELNISETITQSLTPEPSDFTQYILSRVPDASDTTDITTSDISRRTIFRELYIEFDIPANADDKADAVTVNIYNVSLQKAANFFPTTERRITMRIWAGYNNNPNIIFTGTVNKASITVERPNSVLRFQASQLDALRNTSYNVSYPPASVAPPRFRSRLVEEIIKNAREFSNIDLQINPTAFDRIDRASENRTVSGFTHEGMCADALTILLDPIDMNWFVHNGVFNVISKRNFDRFDTDPIIISERSGMIDTPRLTENGLDVRMLLTPTFIPGQNVVVHSRYISDIVPENKPFRIAKVSHRGNNWTGDMVTELSLQDFDKIGNTTDLATALPTDITSPAVILPEEL